MTARDLDLTVPGYPAWLQQFLAHPWVPCRAIPVHPTASVLSHLASIPHCSFRSIIRVAIYPPLLNPEKDGPSLSLLLVTPPPAESLGNQVGRLTFTLFELLGP